MYQPNFLVSVVSNDLCPICVNSNLRFHNVKILHCILLFALFCVLHQILCNSHVLVSSLQIIFRFPILQKLDAHIQAIKCGCQGRC